MRRVVLNKVIHPMNLTIFSMLGVLLSILGLSGCVGPPALRTTVVGYDQIDNQLQQELMLLNIARAHDLSTPHFTVTGSIAATFNFTTTGGVGGTLAEAPGFHSLDLNWGASASENPTFSIVPVSGKEFTKRLVTPLPEDAFSMVVFQRFETQLVMRLMASGIEMQERDGRFQRFLSNDPGRPEEYTEFRRIAMHLAGLRNTHQLFVYNLIFDEVVIDGLKVQPKGEDLWKGKDLEWRLNADGTWKVVRKKRGRTLISNYDPRSLTNQERFELNEIAEDNAGNYVMIDIRPGHPGGDFPFFGAIKLRSYLDILIFIGLGIDKVPEFDVAKDPRTPGPVQENPRGTMAVLVSEQPPAAAVPKAFYKGKYYSLADSYWDRTAFILLSILFQVTVTDVSQVGIPITISK